MVNRKDNHTLFVRISDTLHEDIQNYVTTTGISISEFVKRACSEKLERESNRANPDAESYRSELEKIKALVLEHELTLQKYNLTESAVASEKEKYLKPLRRV